MSKPLLWEIVGGAEHGGILVRESEEMTSKQCHERLATGSIIEELKLAGNRLQYKLFSGTGPHKGWVSVRLKEKQLVRRKQAADSGESSFTTESKSQNSMPSGICVCAVSMAGNSLELNVERDFTVRDLRHVLSKKWSQAPECLKIILGVQPLTDAEQLAAYCSAHDEVISVTVVISLEELYSSLEEVRLPAVQVKALQKLPTLVPHGCDRAITTISKCLESKASSVRQEAVNSLLKVAGRGNQRAIAEVEAKFLHESLDVRLNVLRCWPKLFAQDGERDDRILNIMSELSEDPNQQVRGMALDMLKEVLKKKRVEKGDPFLVALAQENLKKHRNGNDGFWANMLWASLEFAHEAFASEDAIFLDARDDVAFQIGHIIGAWSLPAQALDNLDDLLPTAITESQCPVIVYSDSGSATNCCALVAQRVRLSPLIESHRVFRLIGGLNLWKHRNFPVKGDPNPTSGGEFWYYSMGSKK